MRQTSELLLGVSSGLFVVSACATWLLWPDTGRSGTDAQAGVAFAVGAAAPSALLCLTALLNRLTGGWLAVPRFSIAAAILGIVASPLLLVVSFGVAPLRSMSPRLERLRLAWTLVVIFGSWLVANAIVTAI
ncbi:MAG TPA: hypothetical protein VEK07_12430 [Polyangiaceae bacterium]|nr:hypothetical protein [Polyangiaceae bacterium]